MSAPRRSLPGATCSARRAHHHTNPDAAILIELTKAAYAYNVSSEAKDWLIKRQRTATALVFREVGNGLYETGVEGDKLTRSPLPAKASTGGTEPCGVGQRSAWQCLASLTMRSASC
jgi:hypothetical protein